MSTISWDQLMSLCDSAIDVVVEQLNALDNNFLNAQKDILSTRHFKLLCSADFDICAQYADQIVELQSKKEHLINLILETERTKASIGSYLHGFPASIKNIKASREDLHSKVSSGDYSLLEAVANRHADANNIGLTQPCAVAVNPTSVRQPEASTNALAGQTQGSRPITTNFPASAQPVAVNKIPVAAINDPEFLRKHRPEYTSDLGRQLSARLDLERESQRNKPNGPPVSSLPNDDHLPLMSVPASVPDLSTSQHADPLGDISAMDDNDSSSLLDRAFSNTSDDDEDASEEAPPTSGRISNLCGSLNGSVIQDNNYTQDDTIFHHIAQPNFDDTFEEPREANNFCNNTTASVKTGATPRPRDQGTREAVPNTFTASMLAPVNNYMNRLPPPPVYSSEIGKRLQQQEKENKTIHGVPVVGKGPGSSSEYRSSTMTSSSGLPPPPVLTSEYALQMMRGTGQSNREPQDRRANLPLPPMMGDTPKSRNRLPRYD